MARGGLGRIYESGPNFVVKCDPSKSPEQEGHLMQRFPSTAKLFTDLAKTDEGNICIVMRRLGASLESVISADLNGVWSWNTVGSIGIALNDSLQEFHSGGHRDTC
jgi:hypothetical protein